MTDLDLHPPDFETYNAQQQSPLFNSLPPELRAEVFAFALSDFEDTSRAYSKETYYTRPGYNAPRRTHTELLRTCKRVYAEAWFMPFSYAEHSFYFSRSERAPKKTVSQSSFQRCLDMIYKRHGKLEAGYIRIFAQLFLLEPGGELSKLFGMRSFFPTDITLTLRYTDFWYWEDNVRLWIDPAWVNRVKFPSSVKRFTMDFESISRRQGEIDHLANQAVEKWYFRRADGRRLVADPADITVSTWTGSSTFGDERWLRDEVRPGQLDYYVLSAVWKVERENAPVPDKGPCPKIRIPQTFERQVPSSIPQASLPVSLLKDAGVTDSMPAEEAYSRAHMHMGVGEAHDDDDDDFSDEYSENEDEDDGDYQE